MENREIKFVANAARWFDKVNGNTYHSVNITNVKTGETIYCPFHYGYGDAFKQSALMKMLAEKWLPENYSNHTAINNLYRYERENKYPIMWNVTDGLKRDCIKNGKEA